MIFTRYLLRKFIPFFMGAIAFSTMVLMLIDLMVNLWKYLVNEVPFAQILQVMVLYAPKCLFFAIPLSILFGTCYALSDLYAHNELVAVYASGVSLFSFTRTLLFLSLLFSFGLFLFDDNVVVPTYAKKVALQKHLLGEENSLDAGRIVVISNLGNIVYKVDYFSDAEQRLTDVYIIVRNDDKTLRAILRSDYADWNGDAWELMNPTQYTTGNDTLNITEVSPDILQMLNEPPETFRNNTMSVEEVNAKEAKTYISKLQRTGMPVTEAQSQYYKKFSFPFIVFIVVFLSIGLSGKTRKNVLIISLMLCVFAAVAFYVLQLVTMLLAKFGQIPPVVGAWFPVVLFTGIAIVLLRFAKT
jgi:lipopolysaccharide export system permease protein